MKLTARSLFSAATGIGLTVFTILAAFIAGGNAPVTVVSFSLLAIYGLLEIAILSYASPRFEVRSPARAATPPLAVLPDARREIEPQGYDTRRAA